MCGQGTVVRPVPSLLHTAIYSTSPERTIILRSVMHGDNFVSIYDPLSRLVSQGNPGRDYANYVIESVFWRCLDYTSIAKSLYCIENNFHCTYILVYT